MTRANVAVREVAGVDDDEAILDAAEPTSVDSRRQLIEHRRAQMIEPANPFAGLEPSGDGTAEVRYRRARNASGEWEIIRDHGLSFDRLDQRWQRPAEAYDWHGDLGIRMLTRDLLCDAIELSPADRLPTQLRDRRLLLRFAAVVKHQLGDAEWVITAEHIRRWLDEQDGAID